MVAWAPIIGAGISALGSLFGSKKKKETVEQTVDYVKMAAAAEAAGFNPLTVLRNGGSAGFTSTHHPALSANWGDALGTIGNALMAFDPRADERADLENQLLSAQLKQINSTASGTKGRMMSFDVPSAAGSTISMKPGRGGPPVNMTRNLGPVTKPAFEPVSEWDDLNVSADQAISDVKRVIDSDPLWEWWERVSKAKAATVWQPRANPKPQGNPEVPYEYDPWTGF